MIIKDWGEQDKQTLESLKENPFISNTFKLWIVGIIYFLIILHLYTIIRYPQRNIVSNEILLSVVLALVVYIWVQELKDRHRLQTLNRVLIHARERLERAEIDTISVLILTMEAKDPYVRGHSKNVAEYSLAIAKEMRFPPKRLMIIERAGILHDLGKLAIVDEILNKPSRLNEQEWQIMKSHPQRSIDILEPLEFLTKEKKIILHHHEAYDGNGYPDGLKGEEIPIEARIMAVADTFDAMNSKRAYRNALPQDVIVSELRKVTGSQLDATAVSVFLNLLKKNPHFWERE